MRVFSISNNNILMNNLKINSKWLTLNNILVQFYDICDKYLVKIFLGPIALTAYSIPQQLTGKLSIFSKGFSVILLTILSKKKISNENFNHILFYSKFEESSSCRIANFAEVWSSENH